MNILRRYIHRQLWENRTHSFLSVLSLTIAIALLGSFSTLVFNTYESMTHSIIDVSGNYHAKFTQVDEKFVETMRIHGSVEKVALVQNLETFSFEPIRHIEKNQLHLMGLNQEAMEDFQIRLISGRLPQNDHEILISEDALYQGKIQVELNQPFALSLNDGKTLKNYQVVGIMEIPFFYDKKEAYPLITTYNANQMTKPDAYLTLNDTANINGVLQRIQKHFSNHFEMFEVNSPYVTFTNLFDKEYFSEYWLILLVLPIVLFFGLNILLIRNSFKNSYANREKHLAILKIVGVTQRQCQRLILYEGMILLVVGLILGIIMGISLSGLFTWSINRLLKNISVNSIQIESNYLFPCLLMSCCFVTITAICSMVFSTRKIVYSPVASTLQTSEEVVIQKKPYLELQNKKTTIFTKLLLKNIRQNRALYRQIIFSAIAILSLFIFLNGTMGYLRDSRLFDLNEYNYDVEIMIQNDTYPTRLMTQLKQINHQKSKVIRESLIVDVSSKNLTSEYLSSLKANETPQIQLLVYSDRALETFVLQNRIISANEFFRLTNGDNPIGILINQTYHSAQRRYYDIYDSLTLHELNVENQRITDSLNVIETDHLMSGCSYVGIPQVLVSQKVFDSLTQELNLSTHHYEVFFQSSDPKTLTHELSMLVSNEQVDLFEVKNAVASSEQGKSATMLVRVLGYGFTICLAIMGVLATCCIASTNFEYRKQEFALYRILGLRMKEIRSLIFMEYSYYAVLVFVATILCSTCFNWIVYQQFVKELGIQFFIPLKSILGAATSLILLGGIVLVYSSYKIEQLRLSNGLKNEISLM